MDLWRAARGDAMRLHIKQQGILTWRTKHEEEHRQEESGKGAFESHLKTIFNII